MATPILTADLPPGASTPAKVNDRKRWMVVGLLALGAIVAYCDRNNISAAIAHKPFREHFRMSDTDRGTVLSAFQWLYLLLQIPMGWVVDRYGSKIPYAISLVFWCAATAATGLARSVGDLIALRALTGAGEAIMTPASFSWMRKNFSEQQSGLAVGIYMLGTKIGPAIGAPLAAWLILLYDWRLMFIITGLAGLVWLVPWMLAVKNDRPKAVAKVATAGSTRVTLPLRNILSSPVVWGAIITNYCYNYFVFYCMTWLPAYFVEQRHMSLTSSTLFTSFSFIGIAVVALLSGWAADLLIKRGHNAVFVRKAFIVGGFAIACTELIGVRSATLEGALFWSVVSLSGLGLTTANNLALCRMTLIPPQAAGMVTGVQNVSTSFAGTVSPIIAGWLLQKTGGYDAPMLVIFAFLVLGAVATIVLLRPEWSPKVKVVTTTAAAPS